MKSPKLMLAIATLLFSGVALQAQSVSEGLKAIENEQFNNARRNFLALVKAKPGAESQFFLGYFYNRIQQPDSALMAFQAAKQADAKFALAEVGVGAVELNKGNKAAAQAKFNEALTATKNKSADVMYYIADAYLKTTVASSQDAVEAIKLLDQAILRNNKKPEYFILRGDAFGAMNDGTKAVENFNQALNLNPNSASALLRKGKFYERSRNYTEALKLYQEASQKDASYSLPYKEMGEVYFLAKRYEEAISNYEKYIANSDRNQTIMLNYAEFLIRAKKYPQAVEVLNQLVVENPSNVILNRGLAYAYLETNELDKAASNMNIYLNKYMSSPTDKAKITATDSITYAKILVKTKGDTTRAVNYLSSVFAKDTSKIFEIRAMAKDLFDASAYNYAAVLYQSVINNYSRPNNLDYYNAGRSYFYAKDAAKADSAFKQGFAKFPSFATLLYYRALTQQLVDKDGTKGLAVPFFEEYINTETDKVKYKIYFVRAYNAIAAYHFINKRDKVKANEYFNKTLEIDPNNAAAKEGLAAKIAPAAPAKKAPAKK